MTNQQFDDLRESDSYQKLGNILENLTKKPRIKGSTELLKKVNDAVVIHRILPEEFLKAIEDIKEMQERIDKLATSSNQESEDKEVDAPKSSSESYNIQRFSDKSTT